jgi:hypothetical protein
MPETVAKPVVRQNRVDVGVGYPVKCLCEVQRKEAHRPVLDLRVCDNVTYGGHSVDYG